MNDIKSTLDRILTERTRKSLQKIVDKHLYWYELPEQPSMKDGLIDTIDDSCSTKRICSGAGYER